MSTKYMRTEYTLVGDSSNPTPEHQVRFIKNMKYCDFIIKGKDSYKNWVNAYSKVFIQSNFHEKYNAIKMIGKGSFARVYLVENKDTLEQFAVKAFAKEYLLSQQKGKESLVNEIDLMRELQHPNLIQFIELHESKNSVYLVLELLKGGELYNQVTMMKHLSIRQIQKIMFDILSGLSCLASKGIMHRDLKLENLILKNESDIDGNQVKIVDFGLASKCDVPNYLFRRCGTPGYVAPEIINSSTKDTSKFSPSVDVFSAGVILYTIFMGQSPFSGKNFQDILEQNKECQISLENKKLVKYPQVKDLLEKMLNKYPSQRISAMEALQHEFFQDFEQIEETIMVNLEEFIKS